MTSPPISVLYFTNTTTRAGVEEHILTLARNLDRNRFRPYLACPPETVELLRRDLPADVECVPLRLESPLQVAAAAELRRVLRARRIDILHSHLFQSSRAASPVGWVAKVPLVLETPHLRESWRHGWLKGSFLVDRLVGRFVDYYIAVSEANARYLVTEKKLPARKIVTIRNGVDLARFNALQAPLGAVRERLGFGADDPIIVVLARLEPQKGHRTLLEALHALRGEFPRVRLVCAGEGSLRAELEALTRTLGLEDAVRFVGYQSDPASWLALADFTVLPSHFEGLPIAAIESLAMAKPMVATDVDGTAEVVVHERTGLTVPAGQPDSLARAMARLLRDPGLRRRLGQAGREWVRQYFSQERQVRATEAFYLHALQRSVGSEAVEGRTGEARLRMGGSAPAADGHRGG